MDVQSSRPTVGIITLHYVDNHGGVLLAYALQEKIEQLGYNTCIIDYDPTIVPSRLGHFLKVWLSRFLRLPYYISRLGWVLRCIFTKGIPMPNVHQHKSTSARRTHFEKFRSQYIRLTPQFWGNAQALHNSPPRLSLYVCGSDQIWNPFMCRPSDKPGLDAGYFLDFAPKGKRIAYAPSISVPAIPEHLRVEFTSLLNGVDYLSCREESGAQLIEKLGGRPAKVVVDPALLLPKQDWEKLIAKTETQPYILCYFLGEGHFYREFAIKLARQLNLPIKVISSNRDDEAHLNAEACGDIGPAQFLSLIACAHCVCTDSFHGTLFSIIFERPFFVFERPGSAGSKSMSSRIHSILHRLGLSRRLVKDTDTDVPELKMDYTAARQKLHALREDSIDYLKQSLSSAHSQ